MRKLALGLLLATCACGPTFVQPASLKVDRTRAPVEARTWPDKAPEEELRAAQPRPPSGGTGRALLETKEGHLSNGIRVLLVATHELPVLDFAVVVERGSVDSPAWSFVLNASSRGSKKTPYNESGKQTGEESFFRTLVAMGARWDTYGGYDYSWLWMQALPPLARAPARLAGEAIHEPELDSDDFEAVRKRRIAANRASEADGVTAARRLALHLLYPPGHPYGQDLDELLKAEQALTLQDAKTLHQSLIGKDDVTVVGAGDVDLETFESMFEKTLGTMNVDASPRAPVPIAATPARAVVLMSSRTLRQDHVFMDFLGVPFDHPDYPALRLAASFLGSIAQTRTRLAEGMSYGVADSFTHRNGPAPVEIHYSVEGPGTVRSLSDLLVAIKRLQSTPLDADALARARENSRQLAIDSGDTSGQIVGTLGEIAGLKLTADAWNKLIDRFSGVTVDDIQRVATKYMDIDHVVLVVATADAAGLKRTLPSLGLGAPEVR